MKNLFKKIAHLFIYLFLKPKIKVGDTLCHYNLLCEEIYFNWNCGEWFLRIGESTRISYSIEKNCIKKKKSRVKKEKK